MVRNAPKVYDLLHPSPASLRQLSATAVGVQLWRWKSQADITNGRSFKTVIFDAPPVICQIADEYANKIRILFRSWFEEHLNTVYLFNCLASQMHDKMTNFLDCFCGFDEVINYVEIAKRMMQNDVLSKSEKFKMACLYCFEDDIIQMWPFISNNRRLLDLDRVTFDVFPNLYYWVYVLDNKLDQIPYLPSDGANIEETMFDRCKSYNYSALDYFWRRIPANRRSQKALDLYFRDEELFCRYMLPRLSERQLDKFVSENGGELIAILLDNEKTHQYVLPTWFFIGSKMKEINFFRLVGKMLSLEKNRHIAEGALKDRLPEIRESLSTEHATYLCCEVWKSIPQIFKCLIIETLSIRMHCVFVKCDVRPSEPREVKFLLTMLLDVAVEKRNAFWCNNWRDLIVNTRTTDLHRVMMMCFKNENEIAQFKQTEMSEYKNIRHYCVQLLRDGYFEELNDFLSFCCSFDQSKKRDLKKRLLLSNFLGEEPEPVFNVLHFGRVPSMYEFIRDAFDDDPKLASDFKNQLVSSPLIDHCLFECLHYGYFPGVIKFCKMFVRTERKMYLKLHFVELLRNRWMAGSISIIRVEYLQEFLVWCLGNDDFVNEFKNSISVHEVFNNMVENQMRRTTVTDVPMECSQNFDQFLIWYYDTPEKINEFRQEYKDIFEMFHSGR